MDRTLLPKLGRSLIASVALVFGLVTASWAQAVSYTLGTLSVDITISNSCSTPPTGNGSITFKVNSTEGGVNASLAILGPVNLFPAQNIPAGGTFVFNPPKNLPPGTYRWILGDGTNTIGSLSDPSTYPDLVVRDFSTAPLGITKDIEANNTSCVTQNGQVQATITGGSKNFGFGSYTYSWSSSNGTPTASGTTNGATPLNLATLLGLGGLRGGTYTLLVQDNFSSCSTTQIFTITDPSPTVFTVTTPSPLNVCAGDNITITLSNSEVGVTYEILKNVASLPTPITFPGTGSGPFVMTFPATQFASGNNISVKATNGFCTPVLMTNTVNLIINPLPTASISGTSTICSGGSTLLTFTLPTPGTFNVVYTDGTTNFNANGISNGATVSVSPTANATYTIVSVSSVATSCSVTAPSANITGSAVITVNPLPTANISGTATVCTGGNAILTFTLPTPGTFNVVYTDGTTNFNANGISNGATVSVTPATNKTYTIVSVTNTASSCTATAPSPNITGSAVITVNPLPTASISGTTSICSGNSATLTFTLSAGTYNVVYTDGTTNFTANGISNGATVNVSPTSNKTYTIVSITNTTVASCTVTAPSPNITGSAVVTVNPSPTASISGTSTVCAGGSATLTFTLPTPGTFNVVYTDGTTNFNANGISNGATVSVNPAANTTYTIVSVSNVATSCLVTAPSANITGSAIITVNPLPTASISGTATVCTGGSTALTFTLPAPGTFNVVYTDGTTNFNANGISNGATVNVNPASTKTYTIVSVSNTATSCSVTAPSANITGSAVVTVNPLPTASISGTVSICSGNSATLTFTLSAGTYNVVYTDGTTNFNANGISNGATVSVSPVSTKTYTIVSITNTTIASCTVTAPSPNITGSAVVTVNPSPTASISGTSTICTGGTSTLTFTLPTPGTFNVVYTDGTTNFNANGISNGATVNVSPSANTTYTIVSVSNVATSCLVTAPSANITGSAVITVNPLPTASISGTASICAGNSTTLTFTLSAGTYNVVYTDGTTNFNANGISNGATVSVAPATNKTYTIVSITNTAVASCTVTAPSANITGSAIITVNPRPTASISGTSTICSGSSATLTFTLPAPGTFNVVYTDGTTNFNANGISNGATVSVNPTSNKTYTIVSVSNVATSCLVTAPSANITGSAVVTVNPLPIASISGTSAICSGGNATLTFTLPTPGTFNVTYTDGTTNFILNGVSNGATVNVSPAANTTYTLVSVSNPATTCSVTAPSANLTGSAVISVGALPTASISGTATICAGTSTALTFTLPTPGTFNVVYTNGSTNFNANGISNGATVNVNPVANTTYTIVSVTNVATSCSVTAPNPGITGSAVITVNPAPTASISGTSTICAGGSATLAFTLPAPGTFDVIYTDGTTNFNANGISNGATVSVNPAANTTYTIVSVKNIASSCLVTAPSANITGSAVITVAPLPTASISGTTTLCAGGSTNLTFTLPTPGTFNVVYTDGVTNFNANGISNGATVSVSPAVNRTYTIVSVSNTATSCSVTAPSGNITGSAVVTVNPLPTASISGTTAICSGNSATLTFTLSAGTYNVVYTDGTTNFNANGISSGATVNVSPTANTTYTIVSVTNTTIASCTVSAPSPNITGNAVITISPSPTASISGTATICTGGSTALTFTLPTPGTFDVVYTDGVTNFTAMAISNGATVNVTPAANTTYTIVSIKNTASSCTVTAPSPNITGSAVITVNPLPTASIAGTTTICAGGNATLTFTLSAGTYNVVYTDGTTNFNANGISNGATVSVSPAANTTYTIVSVANTAVASCTVTAPSPNITGSAVITVAPAPTASISGTTTVCSGAAATLTFTLPAPGTFNVVYTDGTTNFNANGISNGATVSVSPSATKTYTIVSVSDITSTCTVTAPNAGITGSAVITVNPAPTAAISGTATVCSGNSTALTFTLPTPGTFDVVYTDGTTNFNANGISNGATVNVTPAANTTYTIVSVSNTATTCSVTAPNAGITGSAVITVSPTPTVAVSGGGTVCSGGTLPDVKFTFTGTPPFNFTYTDGTTPITVTNHLQTTFTITGAAAGTYQVTALMDNGGCAATNLTSSVSVIVNSAPSVVISGGGTVCAGTTLPDVTFKFTGTAPFTFTYNDGTTPITVNNYLTNTFTITGAAKGTYAVTALSDAGACPGADLGTPVDVIVNDLPTAVVSGGGTVCAGSTMPDVTFKFTGTSPFDFTYTDGSTPVTVTNHPSVTFTITAAAVGNYQVTTLTDASGCAATALGGIVSVTVNPAATADAGSPQIICAGNTVTLAGLIGGAATTATWSGGSGSFNPNANDLGAIYTPSLPEATAGSVTLTLTTDDPDGAGPCLAATDNVVITISSGATVDAGPVQTICAGNSATLAGSFTGASGITWTTAGDGTFNNANLTNAIYTPGAADIAAGSVSLTITTGGPCAAAADNVVITINPAATVDAGTPQVTCAGTAVTLSGSFSGSATGLQWTTAGDGIFSDNTDPSSTYTPGTGDIAAGSVVLTATATGTCTGVTDNVTITVNPVATVNAGAPQTICGAASVALGGVIGGSATSATWTGGTGTFNPNANSLNAIYTPSAAERAAGTVTLTLTTNNPTGPCPAASDNVTITINPIPGDQVTFGNDTWIGYVYDDSANPVPPLSNVDFATAKYRGFIDATDIVTLSYIHPPKPTAYDATTDAFDMDLSSDHLLKGPNLCGDPADYDDDFSIRFKMRKSFAAGTYTFTVGGDDGVRLLIDNVPVAGAFNTHSYLTYTGTVCLTAGSHDFVIEYFEHAVIARVSFDYTLAVPPTVTSPVSICLNSPTAPTLTASSTDPSVTGFKWYSDAALTNPVGAGANFTPTLGTNPGELNVTVVGTTSYYVTSVYACGEGTPATVAVNVVNGATLVYNNTSICEANGSVDLTTFVTPTPTGGTFTFSGQPGITGNMFDPTGLSGPVAITVNYAIGACSAPQGTLTLNVTNTSNITVPAAALAICQGNGVIDLNTLVSALPAGGDFVFAGSPGITGDNFDPTGLTGNQVITVNYSLAGSCVAAQKQFTINVSPNATLTTNNLSVCPGGGTVNLLTLVNGTPAGGTFTFTGTGVTGNTFDPTGLAGTTVSITVQYVSAGCGPVSGAISMQVKAANDVTCGGTGSDCANFSAIIPTITTQPTCSDRDAGEVSFSIQRADATATTFRVIWVYKGVTPPTTQTKFTNGTVLFSDLKSGLYTYTVIDEGNGKSCGPVDFFLDLKTQVHILDKQVLSNVTCFGGTDGNVMLTVDGSLTGQYWYKYVYKGQESSAQTFTPGAPLPEGLPADDTDFIILKVDDNQNFTCPDTAMVRIKHLFPKVNMTVNTTDVTTCNGSDGVIDVLNISGGNTTSGALKIRLRRLTSALGDTEVLFDYEDVVSAAKSYSDLGKGDYYVDIIDNSDCVTTYPSAIQIKAPGLNLTIPALTVTNADCSNGGKSGSILFNISAPDGIYKVAISADPLNVPADDQFVDYNTLVLPNVKFDQLARGGYYFYVKSSTSPCPTRTDNPVVVDGPYQIGDFEIIQSCSTPDITITNISGEPGKPMVIQVYDNADPFFQIDELAVTANATTATFHYTPTEHSFLTGYGNTYRFVIVQEQTSCTITSADKLQVISQRLDLTVTSKPSFPNPKRTGSIVIDNIIGGTPFLSADNQLYYNVTITDENGATVIDSQPVTLNPQKKFSKSFDYLSPGIYTITVEDDSNCNPKIVQIEIQLDPSVYVPNIFTPNEDAVNDRFEVLNLPAGKHTLIISNRWGNEVFKSTNYSSNNFWDAKEASDGIYFYRLQLDGGATYTGWVEVLRGTKP